jgi:hypothetical protein
MERAQALLVIAHSLHYPRSQPRTQIGSNQSIVAANAARIKAAKQACDREVSGREMLSRCKHRGLVAKADEAFGDGAARLVIADIKGPAPTRPDARRVAVRRPSAKKKLRRFIDCPLPPCFECSELRSCELADAARRPPSSRVKFVVKYSRAVSDPARRSLQVPSGAHSQCWGRTRQKGKARLLTEGFPSSPGVCNQLTAFFTPIATRASDAKSARE